MVPYVRKSFNKHYRDALKYIAGLSEEEVKFEVPSYDVGIDERNKYIRTNCWQYAMDMTEKETHQAVEGLYHNLRSFGRLNSNIENIAA